MPTLVLLEFEINALGWVVKRLQLFAYLSSGFHVLYVQRDQCISCVLPVACSGINVKANEMIWLCRWPMCPAPVHLLPEASVVPPLQIDKDKHTQSFSKEGSKTPWGDGWEPFKTAAWVRACVFECLCVRERQRHKGRIKGVAGKRQYIVGKRRTREQLSYTITHQMLWLCRETYCSGGLTANWVDLSLEGNALTGK